MEFKTMLECMNEKCRTVILVKNTDGLRCVRCGGKTNPMPFVPMKQQNEHDKSKELTIQVNADTTGALKGIKKVTEATNECVAAFEKLEKVIGRFTNKNDSLFIEVPVALNGKVIAQKFSEFTEIKERF